MSEKNKTKQMIPGKSPSSLSSGKNKFNAMLQVHSEQRFLSPLPPPELLKQYKENGWEDCLRSLIKDANERENRKISIFEEQELQHAKIIDAQAKEIKRASLAEMTAKIASVLIVLVFAGMIVYSFFKGEYTITMIFTAITLLLPVLSVMLGDKIKK